MEAEAIPSDSPVISDVGPDEEIAFHFADTRQRTIVASMFIFVAVVGTIGNFLVILAVIVSKKLRTATNAFVVNLAVADLLTALCVPWNAVALLGFEGLPVPEPICSIAAGVMFTCVGCSLYTLASIAINRLILITKPLHVYRKLFQPKLIGFSIVLIWVIPFCLAVVPPLFDAGALGYNEKYHTCSGKSAHKNSNTFDVIQAVGLYPIPLITIIGCYITIYIHVRKHVQKMRRKEREGTELSYSASGSFVDNSKSPTRPLSSANSKVPNNNLNSTVRRDNRSKLSRRQVEITKNLFYVVCAFFICLTPYSVCLVYDDSDPAVPYAGAFVLFNSCINPIIYATKHPYFKKVFKCILLCRWQNIPEPASFVRSLRSSKDNCCGNSSCL
ncbi:G-protein coupled receptor moody [Holothuria leucospilota]|uniref:G-protein coupled receptor moody n=1 Tax=Holothuria leucospilota TaxID=206669 RepID=A0A9Q0YLL3_HOLLE|nr:G-protein coupled receptor moody [Holothuria leucospilota]